MRNIIFIFTLFCVSLVSQQVQAQEQFTEFYVELGRAPSEAQAKADFKAIREKNKQALLDYDVFPNAILQPDGSFIYRVQAGPMLDKPEAQRVCRRLQQRSVSCFIIEGFDPAKPESFAKAPDTNRPLLKSKKAVLPWLEDSAKVEVVAAREDKTEEKEESFFDNILSIFDDKDEEKPEEKAAQIADTQTPKTERKAKVEVAEAIPVAVSEDKTKPVEAVAISEPAPVAERGFFSRLFSNDEGWLIVHPFLDEKRAKKFWEELKKRADTARTGGLEMQAVYPVVAGSLPKVSANIGTFESEEAAMLFCSEFVIPASRHLECRFSYSQIDGESAATQQAEGLEEHSLYWLEMLSVNSQDEALARWEKIRTDHDDLLSNVRSQITTSLSKPGVYVVRVGPLNSRSKAVRLCNQLKKRQLDCKLVSL